MSSYKKLEEAQFFLELLEALDRRRRPLTHTQDSAKEASFLFSAILNSFYSAVVIMRDEENIDVAPFVKAHPEIYGRANQGGERAKTVHVSHTDIAYSGYIPPKGDAVNFNFRKPPVLIEESHKPGNLELVFGPDHYMWIEVLGKQVQVTDFCYNHFYQLKRFHAQHQTTSPPVGQTP